VTSHTETLDVEEVAGSSADLEDAAELPLSALDLPPAPPILIDTRDIALDEIEQLSNIRPHFHGIEGLALTMHAEGQLQPCVVRITPDEAAHGKPFELVFGYRRYLAAQSLGWKTLRCEVHEVPDASKRRQLIIENLQRSDLTPVAEARAFYELKYEVMPPRSNAEVARLVGCDPSQVSHRLTMLIKLAPPRPAAAPPQAHELAQKPTIEPDGGIDEDFLDELLEEDTARVTKNTRPLEDKAEETAEDKTGKGAEEKAEEQVEGVPVRASLPASAVDASGLILPGTPADDPEPTNEETAPCFDILALVDEGTISASTAEIIASLDTREAQEHLAKLVVRHGWGVKKTSAWLRANRIISEEGAADDGEITPLEKLSIADVVSLRKLHIRPDASASEVERIILYMQLRNGMDQEMLDFINERGYSYDNLWGYLSLLNEDEVQELQRRLALRFVEAGHRFHTLEESLKAEIGLPEEAPADDVDASSEASSLPVAEATGDNNGASDLDEEDDDGFYDEDDEDEDI